MRKPALQDDAFLADVAACPRRDGNFRLWWLGQSGFLLGWGGVFALLDPYLSDSLTTKYERSDKPHVRLMERVVDPRRLDFIAVTICSHGHTDHQDPDTLGSLLQNNANMELLILRSTYELCRTRNELPQARVRIMDENQTISAGPFTITAIASAHETIEYDADGACRYLGYVLRFGIDFCILDCGARWDSSVVPECRRNPE